MSAATTRILRLLGLLQTRRDWSGSELGERLEVDVRTVRRDVERLRSLGYSIEASSGVGGGYRMSAGTTTPPLLLDDEEATALVVALNVAASTIGNLRETSLAILMKLDQILPTRLRPKLASLESATFALLPREGATMVDWKVLTALSEACRDRHGLEFEYQDREGKPSRRRVEPVRVVHTGRLWYVVAWDVERQDFRTFRVDRIDGKRMRRGARFEPRELPEDIATYVAKSLVLGPYTHRIVVRLRGSVEELSRCIPPWLGLLEASTGGETTLTFGANGYRAAATMLLHIEVPILGVEPKEAAVEMARATRRLALLLEGKHARGRTESDDARTSRRRRSRASNDPKESNERPTTKRS